MTVLSTLPMANARLLEKRGRCSKGSRWTLSLERENSIIDVDFEAENRVLVEQDWDIIIRNNNRTVFQRTVPAGTSFGNDSSDNAQDDEVDNDSIYIFDVSTDIVNRRGRDRVVARATASETGEVCVGTLVLR
jgi:hypothetical protein